MKMRLRKCVLQLEWKLKTVPVSIFVDDLWLHPFHFMKEKTFFYCKLQFFPLLLPTLPIQQRFFTSRRKEIIVVDRRRDSAFAFDVWGRPAARQSTRPTSSMSQFSAFILFNDFEFQEAQIEFQQKLVTILSVVRWLWKLIRLIVHKINMQLFLIRVISIALTQKSFKFNFFFLKLSFLWFYHKSQTIISSRETRRNENLKFKIFQLSVISHFSISHNWPTRLTETSVDSLAISPKHWNRLVDFNLNVAHSWRS